MRDDLGMKKNSSIYDVRVYDIIHQHNRETQYDSEGILSHEDYCYGLTTQQIARWFCLFDGIDTVFDKLEELGTFDSFGEDKKELTRIDRCLAKFVEQRFQTVHADIILEAKKSGLH